MKWLKYTIFLAALLPALAQAQYRGSGRPLSRQETLDSLAAKPDTSVTNQLQAELDSTQDSLDTRMPRSGFLKEGSNITITEHGSSPPDSATIASTGGGGGSNWSPADSTLSFDLPYYFGRNVVQITGTDDYDDWANGGTGTHADETTDYLTDAQSITGTFPSAYNGSYVYLAKSLDLAHFPDGDTCVATDIIIYSVNITAAYIDSLNPGSLILAFYDGSNILYAYTSYTTLSAGWNHIKIQKSAFSGSADWGAITQVRLGTGAVAPTGEVVYDFDNIQLVRGIDGEPNPYQSEGPDGTWTADWTEEGNGNIWIVEESGVISVMNPGTWGSSYLLYGASLADYEASGILKASVGPLLWQYKDGANLFTLYSNEIKLKDSTGTFHTNTFNFSTGDKIFWKFSRKGTSITASASLTGNSGDWATVSTFGYSGLIAPRIYIDPKQRTYSLGAAAVEYAAEAGVAQRLYGWVFDVLGDSLQVTHGDSVYNVLINSRRAK